ncbi:hypothetical protein I4Q36_08720 [Tuanshanicoccus lijuaniae]|uniref:hypothetical protein n=1 Tax=Aerococcaceae bacterium zg-1292 TaxID=2774330 RepID=UPI0019361493|nr:hypothetical protein I4Q36_08720 [Aerococcaceae bacterium zg-1292]
MKYPRVYVAISNTTATTSEKTLNTYYRYNVIEAHNNSMKNFLAFDRLYKHKNQYIRGKFIILFIELMLKAVMTQV